MIGVAGNRRFQVSCPSSSPAIQRFNNTPLCLIFSAAAVSDLSVPQACRIDRRTPAAESTGCWTLAHVLHTRVVPSLSLSLSLSGSSAV